MNEKRIIKENRIIIILMLISVFLVVITPSVLGDKLLHSYNGMEILITAWCIEARVPISAIIILIKFEKKRKEELVEISKLAKYDEKNDTLILSKFSPLLVNAIEIKARNNYKIKYEPQKLHYGSVTVGGVTTGGTYTTGGYNYISSSEKNGLCDLCWCLGHEYTNFIDKIVIPKELCDLAQKSPIASYVDYSTHTIIVSENVPLSEAEGRRMLDNLKTTGYIGNEFANEGKPTIEKGIKIMDFITQEINVSDIK